MKRQILSGLLIFAGAVFAGQPKPFWMSPSYSQPEPQDTQTAFRGSFSLQSEAEVEFRFIGASWFNAWIDGNYLADGPARFPRAYPEYDTRRLRLGAGRHVIGFQVHYSGVDTRVMNNVPPFLACAASANGATLPISWRSLPLPGVRATSHRRSPLQGWMEWFDTRPVPPGWREITFDDSKWLGVAPANPGIGEMKPLNIPPVEARPFKAKEVARGPLARVFGMESEDPALTFFLSDRQCVKFPPQGLWRRYDLGRTMIARPRFTLDVPAGTLVKFGSTEELLDGKVAPWSAFSGSPTCFVDHYIAQGGVQEFFPMTSQGARFYEVHVFAPENRVRFLKEEFFERSSLGEPLGEFHCGDALLEQIWRTGVNTVHSSCEDALVDSRRERGQWIGDLLVGARILATSYPDLRVARRGLVQSAQCAHTNGLVAALCPGMCDYIPGYSALWVGGVLDYWEMTGDRSLLVELYPAAERNIAPMLARLGPAGITNGLGWNFIDWGYIPNSGECEVVCNLQILEALRSMKRWCMELEKDDSRYASAERQLANAMRAYFSQEVARGGDFWKRIGYQRAIFGLRTQTLAPEMEAGAVSHIKRYIKNCFPANSQGQRLSDPFTDGEFFTPYFANFALEQLTLRSEMDFVLDQYRACWGWALKQGLRTWPEVFDTRWSHCHQWSGSPTWMLSRYVLGLHPRHDLGTNHFSLRIEAGSLKKASGKVALREGGVLEVAWKRNRDGSIRYEAKSDSPVWLYLPGEINPRKLKAPSTFVLPSPEQNATKTVVSTRKP